MTNVPLITNPNKALNAFAKSCRFDTTRNGVLATLKVNPLSTGEKGRAIDGWKFSLPDSAYQDIDIDSGTSIALSPELYVYVKRKTATTFMVAVVHYSADSGPAVVQEYPECSAWEIRRWGDAHWAGFQWQSMFWIPKGNDAGYGQHERAFDAKGKTVEKAPA